MASQTDICNTALTILGAASINAITDQTNQARALNAVWNMQRDSEIRKHRWKFAIQRTTLPALAATPASGVYNTQFELPAGCLRVLEVGDQYPGCDLTDYRNSPSLLDYSVEGGMILTNLGAPLSLRFMAQIVDPTQWDACFADAMAARLAAVTCFRITQSVQMVSAANGAYKQAIMDAVRANALETTPQVPADDTWIMARPIGSGGAPITRFG